ncbi:hypothetical protein [Pararobbsia silviterrae]|uniref:Uncharacterized protein n=1 Tax=Pararobbsia silviterrae TaxID=1792498 RepID=A0A494Y1A4_9BURK|nr:hypothetical protein [Pararobbsia silviterrae]RKP53635.1 hypothetical protein D7S86_15285 [Pararobbsia silviterrae]
MRAWTGLLALCPVLCQAATFAAFIQPDPATSKIPYEAVTIARKDSAVDSRQPIQACDRIRFVTTQTQYGVVYVTTLRGGKNFKLDASHPFVDISCVEPGIGDLPGRSWKDISGGDRATYSIAAMSRGDQLSVPILTSEQSNLVAAPKRSIFIEWSGGTPPYRVVLRNSNTGAIITSVDNVTEHAARTPPVDLAPGQYSLSVFNTPADGAVAEIRENNLFVVPSDQLPPPPRALADAKLDETDKALLYVYYLEGFGDGRWAFEAMQRATAIMPPSSGSKDWLAQYGGD